MLLRLLAKSRPLTKSNGGKETCYRYITNSDLNLLDVYKTRLGDGSLTHDEQQHKTVKLFDRLGRILSKSSTNEPVRFKGIYLHGGVGTGKTMIMDLFLSHIRNSRHDSANTAHLARRVHFNEFMLEVNKRLHEEFLLDKKLKDHTMEQQGNEYTVHDTYNTSHSGSSGSDNIGSNISDGKNNESESCDDEEMVKKTGAKASRDASNAMRKSSNRVDTVAQQYAKEFRVLCFDEFQITDICDALVIKRLFEELWRNNVVIILTSNRPPQDIYLNGLNREYFLSFLDRLENEESVVAHLSSSIDYRLNKPRNLEKRSNFITPASKASSAELSDLFEQHCRAVNEMYDPIFSIEHKDPSESESESESESTKDHFLSNYKFPVSNGRFLNITKVNKDRTDIDHPDTTSPKGIAYISFDALCRKETGAADYRAICSHFHTLYVDGIPHLSESGHNEARRFITLIDELYNANVMLVCTAATGPADLFAPRRPKGRVRLADDHTNTRETSGSRNEDIIIDNSTDDKSKNDSAISYRDNNSSSTKGTTVTAVERGGSLEDSPSAYLRNAEQRSRVMSIDKAEITEFTQPDSNFGESEIAVLEGELASIKELGFAFRRAASRLAEMDSALYYQRWWEIHSV